MTNEETQATASAPETRVMRGNGIINTGVLLEICLDIDDKLRDPKPMFWDFADEVASVLDCSVDDARLMSVRTVIRGYLAKAELLGEEERVFLLGHLACNGEELLRIKDIFI